MARKHLFEDIKQNPARIYRAPADVLRDRRFGDGERLEILQAWREIGNPELSVDIAALIAELESRMMASAQGHAAE